MFKLSSLDKAKLLASWTNALKNDKVSVWARNNLPEHMKELTTNTDRMLVGKWNGVEKIIVTMMMARTDSVTVMVYNPEIHAMESQDGLAELEGLSWLDETTMMVTLMHGKDREPLAEIAAERMSGEKVKLILADAKSSPFLGGTLYRHEESQELILVKPQFLKSHMKA
ncbi:hypothetical protein [Vibrio phage vB_pir03]|nr:hypothetical protein [Vibrio phage vB_pir03]